MPRRRSPYCMSGPNPGGIYGPDPSDPDGHDHRLARAYMEMMEDEYGPEEQWYGMRAHRAPGMGGYAVQVYGPRGYRRRGDAGRRGHAGYEDEEGDGEEGQD